MGVVIAASAVGNLVYPFIIPPLADHFGWRGSLLICSAMYLHTCVVAMFIKPQFTKSDNVNTKDTLNYMMNKSKEVHQKQSMVKVTKDLFCDLRFNILFVLTGFYMTGSSVVFTYLAGYAKTMGVGDWEADLLVSVMGGFSLGGRWVILMLPTQWQIQRVPPKGPNSFILSYKFYET